MNLLFKKALFFVCITVFATQSNANQPYSPFLKEPVLSPLIVFVENKGQIGDQYHKARPDVIAAGTDRRFTFHLKKDGISYQQYKVESWVEDEAPGFNKKLKFPEKTSIYRVDVKWLNANVNPVIEKKDPLPGYSNYYLESCPDGVSGVRSFREIVYKNIYRGIDLTWYEKNGHLKYDYILEAGADHKNILLEFSGAEKISINSYGELVIKTPLGEITEEAPLVLQNGKKISAKWKISGNVVSFDISGFNSSLPMIIDPGVRVWGTYYGGAGGDAAMCTTTDASGNVFTAGYTNSAGGTAIATSGSHQFVYSGGQDNAFLVKFNSSNLRLWATYYGGSTREFGTSCAVDPSGNIYLAGNALSSNAIATAGSHQSVFAGAWDGYLIKFNTNGVRQWGTYYGDTGVDQGNGVACDPFGNVYLSGKAQGQTGTSIATAGAHQPNFGGIDDAYLVKFNSSGVRLWGTLYGGAGLDIGRGCITDPAGNVYMCGVADNSTGNAIASAVAHQTVYGGGGSDGFLVKFNSSGVRQWGTYYGGTGEDKAHSVKLDPFQNIYIAGKTVSGNNISTSGSHQSGYGGGPFDAFLAKFTNSGTRLWATYYGGSGDEEGWGCSIHPSGFVYMAGHTSSPGGTTIATPGSHQPTFGGGTNDAFIVQFDTLGIRQWGSYYGGIMDESANGTHTDPGFNVYLTGVSDSNTGTVIASGNGHQPVSGGGWGDGYIVKFYDCVPSAAPTNSTSATNETLCAGANTTLSAVPVTGTVNWFNTASGGSAIGTGTNYITPTLNAGTYTYYAEAQTCTVSARTAITITVHPLPSISAFANPGSICGNKSSTLSASGADTYTWSNGAQTSTAVVTPGSSTTYTIIGTDTLGCVNSRTVAVTTLSLPAVSLGASRDTSCLVLNGAPPVGLSGSPSGGNYSGLNVSGSNFIPTAVGVFYPAYTVTDGGNGCQNTATVSIVVMNCTSVEEHSAKAALLLIYPNPNNGEFVLSSKSDMELGISNELGQYIRTVSLLSNNNYTSTIKDLSPGVYFITSRDGKWMVKQKVVVIK